MSLYERSQRTLLAGDIIGEMIAWYTPSSGGAMGYLESLDKMDTLDIDLILPSHGDLIVDAKRAIQGSKDKILARDHAILQALQAGSKSFQQLLRLVFPSSPSVQFFPGTPILKTHLQRLKTKGLIEANGSGPTSLFSV
jgi:glyoxylase-like metal-dependent hydrolase (beta-lactamase superfamily II)